MNSTKSTMVWKLPFLLALFASLVLHPAAARAAGDAPEETAGRVGFPVLRTSFAEISSLHRNIQNQVESGSLALAKGQSAQEIWLSLQEYLAAANRQVQRLENETLQPSDAPRLGVLRKLERTVAEREKVMASAFLALHNIAHTDGPGGNGFGNRPEPDTVKKTAPDAGSPSIEIEIAPTDALIEDLE